MSTEYVPSLRRGFLCLPVLPFLKGLPWDGFAMNFIPSLDPSSVRVVEDGKPEYCDSRPGRVTVRLCKNVIRKIEQECIVGLEGVEHGHALYQELCKRVGEGVMK